MTVTTREKRRGESERAKLAAYRAQGIELDRYWGPGIESETNLTGPAWLPGWSWEWLVPRLIAPDHTRVMVHNGQVVGVMTQPYGINDLGRWRPQLTELELAGYEVDLCPVCSPHYPGSTLAVIHYRPTDNPPQPHLPHD